MTFGPESSDPRERRAYAHATLVNARSGSLEDLSAAELAVLNAGSSRKSRQSGFRRALSRAALLDPWTRIITERANEVEMAALAQDTMATKGLIVEETSELNKLGPLVEGQTEDGSRRFHIGDVLSITTGRLTSPRGMDGIYDILGYMTNDSPFTTQLVRLAEECKPYLVKQLGEAIEPYSGVPETVKDNLSLYKWLYSVTEGMNGDPFLKVSKVGEKDHAVMDPLTELELDLGPEVMMYVIQYDPN